MQNTSPFASPAGLLVAALLAPHFTGPAALAGEAGGGRAAASGEVVTAPELRLKRNQVKAETAVGDEEFRALQARGLQGDRDAARRVAMMFKRGTNGVPRDERKMVQWLLHASNLNSAAASYDLYLYFLEQRLDRDAVYFEKRAIEQGFVPPPRLDPRRG